MWQWENATGSGNAESALGSKASSVTTFQHNAVWPGMKGWPEVMTVLNKLMAWANSGPLSAVSVCSLYYSLVYIDLINAQFCTQDIYFEIVITKKWGDGEESDAICCRHQQALSRASWSPARIYKQTGIWLEKHAVREVRFIPSHKRFVGVGGFEVPPAKKWKPTPTEAVHKI